MDETKILLSEGEMPTHWYNLVADLPKNHFDGVFVSNFLEHLLSQEQVAEFLGKMHGHLKPGGRIAVMAYQSLEDRIVKSQFAAATASRTPEGLPVELPGH